MRQNIACCNHSTPGRRLSAIASHSSHTVVPGDTLRRVVTGHKNCDSGRDESSRAMTPVESSHLLIKVESDRVQSKGVLESVQVKSHSSSSQFEALF